MIGKRKARGGVGQGKREHEESDREEESKKRSRIGTRRTGEQEEALDREEESKRRSQTEKKSARGGVR